MQVLLSFAKHNPNLIIISELEACFVFPPNPVLLLLLLHAVL